MSAYTLAYFPILIISASIIWIIFAFITRLFQNILDLFVNMYPSIISEQTITTANSVVAFLIYAPAILLIIVAIWAIIRNVGRRE